MRTPTVSHVGIECPQHAVVPVAEVLLAGNDLVARDPRSKCLFTPFGGDRVLGLIAAEWPPILVMMIDPRETFLVGISFDTDAAAFHDRLVLNFYFGCEADDRMAVWAFNDRLNQFGARLKAVFSSDIGHWDVPDATTVLAESYGLVEDGHLSPDDYRNFVFTNAVTLYAGLNRDFYKCTAIEKAAAAVLAEEEGSRPRA